jgi:hypothetical protein
MVLLAWILRGCTPPKHFITPFMYQYRHLNSAESFIPESPLYCPHPWFFSISTDARCTARTYVLLCEMRGLTCGLIDINIIGPRETCELTVSNPFIIYARILALPPANVPGQAISTDWTYEACRLAACIYCSQLCGRPTDDVTTLFPAIHELHAALVKSDVSDCWDGMAGVLFWCALVGANCMQDALQQVSSSQQIRRCKQDLPRHEHCKKWLTLLAVRLSVVLGFQYPSIICTTLRRYVHVRGLHVNMKHRSS